jgi:hypothetical protein
MRHRTVPAPAGGDGNYGARPHDRPPRCAIRYPNRRRKKPLIYEAVDKRFLDSCNLPWRERADADCIGTNFKGVDLAIAGCVHGKENLKSAERAGWLPIKL